MQDGTNPYFGAVVGRCANRIAQGSFSIDGKDYQLAINNPPNALHGGTTGFDKRIWAAREFKTAEGDDGVQLTRTSKDGEEVSTAEQVESWAPGSLNVVSSFDRC